MVDRTDVPESASSATTNTPFSSRIPALPQQEPAITVAQKRALQQLSRQWSGSIYTQFLNGAIQWQDAVAAAQKGQSPTDEEKAVMARYLELLDATKDCVTPEEVIATLQQKEHAERQARAAQIEENSQALHATLQDIETRWNNGEYVTPTEYLFWQGAKAFDEVSALSGNWQNPYTPTSQQNRLMSYYTNLISILQNCTTKEEMLAALKQKENQNRGVFGTEQAAQGQSSFITTNGLFPPTVALNHSIPVAYQNYENILYDYLQKEDRFWHDARPNASTDPRVGLLEKSLKKAATRYNSLVNADAAFAAYQEEQLRSLNKAMQADPNNNELKKRWQALREATSFADYAKKTGQYPDFTRFLQISDADDNKHKVNAAQRQIEATLEARFNAEMALHYYMSHPTAPAFELPFETNHILEAEKTLAEYLNLKNNENTQEAQITLLQAISDAKESTTLYQSLTNTIEKSPQWQHVLNWALELANQDSDKNQNLIRALKSGDKTTIALELAQVLGLPKSQSTLLNANASPNKSILDKQTNEETLFHHAKQAEQARQEYIAMTSILNAHREHERQNNYQHSQQNNLQQGQYDYQNRQTNSSVSRTIEDIPLSMPNDFSPQMAQIDTLVQRFARRNDYTTYQWAGGMTADLAAGVIIEENIKMLGTVTLASGGTTAPVTLTAIAASMAASIFFYDEIASYGEAAIDKAYDTIQYNVLQEHKASCNFQHQKAKEYQKKCAPYWDTDKRRKMLTFARNRLLLAEESGKEPNNNKRRIIELALEKNITLFAASVELGITPTYVLQMEEGDYEEVNGKKVPKSQAGKDVLAHQAAHLIATGWETEYQMMLQLEDEYNQAYAIDPVRTEELAKQDVENFRTRQEDYFRNFFAPYNYGEQIIKYDNKLKKFSSTSDGSQGTAWNSPDVGLARESINGITAIHTQMAQRLSHLSLHQYRNQLLKELQKLGVSPELAQEIERLRALPNAPENYTQLLALLEEYTPPQNPEQRKKAHQLRETLYFLGNATSYTELGDKHKAPFFISSLNPNDFPETEDKFYTPNLDVLLEEKRAYEEILKNAFSLTEEQRRYYEQKLAEINKQLTNNLPDNGQIQENINAINNMAIPRFEMLNMLHAFANKTDGASPMFLRPQDLPQFDPAARYNETHRLLDGNNLNAHNKEKIAYRFDGEAAAYDEMTNVLMNSPKWKEVCAFMAKNYYRATNIGESFMGQNMDNNPNMMYLFSCWRDLAEKGDVEGARLLFQKISERSCDSTTHLEAPFQNTHLGQSIKAANQAEHTFYMVLAAYNEYNRQNQNENEAVIVQQNNTANDETVRQMSVQQEHALSEDRASESETTQHTTPMQANETALSEAADEDENILDEDELEEIDEDELEEIDEDELEEETPTVLPTQLNDILSAPYNYQALIDMYQKRLTTYEQLPARKKTPAATHELVSLSRESINAITETMQFSTDDTKGYLYYHSLEDYRDYLQEELNNPNLSAERKTEIQNTLAYLGDAESFAELGANNGRYDGTNIQSPRPEIVKRPIKRHHGNSEVTIKTIDALDSNNVEINKNIAALQDMQAQRVETIGRLRLFATSSSMTDIPTLPKNCLPKFSPEKRYQQIMSLRKKEEATKLEFQFNGEKQAYLEMTAALTESPKWKEVCAFMASQYPAGSKERQAWEKGDLSLIQTLTPTLNQNEESVLSDTPDSLKKEANAANDAQAQFCAAFCAFNNYHIHLNNQRQGITPPQKTDTPQTQNGENLSKRFDYPFSFKGDHKKTYLNMRSNSPTQTEELNKTLQEDIGGLNQKIQAMREWAKETFGDNIPPELEPLTEDPEKMRQMLQNISDEYFAPTTFEERMQIDSLFTPEQQEARKNLQEHYLLMMQYQFFLNTINTYNNTHQLASERERPDARRTLSAASGHTENASHTNGSTLRNNSGRVVSTTEQEAHTTGQGHNR